VSNVSILYCQITVHRWQSPADKSNVSSQGRYAIIQEKLEKSAYALPIG